ncbi:TraK domain-containing protein [Rugamonas aquatica]|uniref:Conjugal transfer pilus assembly protein TraK n=1 Tax=Rugamonas aquatica TaxID=2743357 RepID=A0A6A7N713_9BURK|nr:type-F conjugative transfer system secretin TraK [Rugamonas aquatica]MQA40597.1 conjugal transfer pilus assembly protein TraK [Rugamonas aquatica]
MKSVRDCLLPALLAGGAAAAYAAGGPQTLDVSDGVTVEARISSQGPTRIRVEGARIQDVIGNVYASSCSARQNDPSGLAAAQNNAAINPGGEFILGCDAAKGEVYLRPVAAGAKPISLFIATDRATYTMLLTRTDSAAETIVLRDKDQPPRPARGSQSAARGGDYVRGLKAMLLALAAAELPDAVSERRLQEPQQLWRGAGLVLERTLSGYDLAGDHYTLTNLGPAPMVLAEQEFDRDDVLAVSIESLTLRPGESTSVFIIRSGSQP